MWPSRSAGALVAFAFAVFALFYGAPLVFVLVESFYDNSGLGSRGAGVGLTQYRAAITSGQLRDALTASLVFTIATVTLELATALGAALLSRRQTRGASVVRALLILPYFLPSIVIVVAWRFVSDPFVGPIAGLLRLMGHAPLDLRGPQTALPLMVLVATYEAFPFGYVVLLARVLQIPAALYEQAEISGATPVQAFGLVTWPQLRGVVMGVAAVRMLLTWMKFDVPWLVYANQAPSRWGDTLPVLLYRLAFERLERGRAYAASVLILAATAIVGGLMLLGRRRRLAT